MTRRDVILLAIVIVAAFLAYFVYRFKESSELLVGNVVVNQSSARAVLRTICTAELTYASTYQSGFSSSLTALGSPKSGSISAVASGLLDDTLASGLRSGYLFTYTPVRDSAGRNHAFGVTANPVRPCKWQEPCEVADTGAEYYFVDETCVVRANLRHEASGADPQWSPGP